MIPSTEGDVVQGQHQTLGKPSPAIPDDIELALLDPQLLIVDRILQANRTSALLEEQRSWAMDDAKPDWTLEEGCLLYKNRLVVPDEKDIHARLLDEIHQQASTAHPGWIKTKTLLGERYYWKNWRMDVNRYLDNCMTCKWNMTWQDHTPGLLQLLPIPD
jgi:hypothetical protein